MLVVRLATVARNPGRRSPPGGVLGHSMWQSHTFGPASLPAGAGIPGFRPNVPGRPTSTVAAPLPSEVVIEQLVDQIEARFADAQREMSDPDIFGDRQRAAAAGRNYRQLQA